MRQISALNGMKLGLAIALLALVALGPAAAGTTKQMDAADDPTVTGLDPRSDDCRSQQEKDSVGNVVAVGKTCLRVYSYSPASETDADKNYGVVWLQSNVNSRSGWCAATVRSDVNLADNLTVEQKAPPALDIKRRRPYQTSLTVSAGGTAMTEGSISQDQILYPKSVRTRVTDDNVFRLRWSGLKDKKLGFASGAEISWPADQSPGKISFRLNYAIKPATC